MYYEGALSDTDILIHLAKANKLDLLPLLFKKIIIPKYIYEVELVRKASKLLGIIRYEVNRPDSIFEVFDRETDKVINIAAKPVIDELRDYIGRGEAECAGYSVAYDIPIIISDNWNEFNLMPEYIMLSYRDLLSLCVKFEIIAMDAAEEYFNTINSIYERPTTMTFAEIYDKSIQDIYNKGWHKPLKIEEYQANGR